MKLKEGFLLREIAGEIVVLPTGNDLDLNMMITLNETGKFLWEHLETETDLDGLVKAVLGEYAVEEAEARTYIEKFVAQLKEYDFLA